MQKVTDPAIIERVKALAEAQRPSDIATPDTAANVKVTDPATIARVNMLASSQHRTMVPKTAVDNFLAAYRSGVPLTPGARELIEDQEPSWAERYLEGGGKMALRSFLSVVPATMTSVGGAISKAAGATGLPTQKLFAEGLAKYGNNAQKFLDEKLAVENPNLYHHIMGAAGSVASFMLPGLWAAKASAGAVKGISWADRVWKIAGREIKAAEVLQGVIGSTAMSTLESSVEMADLMQQKMDEGMTADQAMSEAQRVFNLNMPVLMATNMGYFHPASRLARMALEAVSEGGQERYQGVVQDVVSGRGKWSDFLDPNKYQTETLVGAIIGGAGGAASPGVSQGERQDTDTAPPAPTNQTFQGQMPEGMEAYDDGEAPGGPQEQRAAPEGNGTAEGEIDAEARARARERPSTPLGEPVDEYTAVLAELQAEKKLLEIAKNPQPIETPEQTAAREAAGRQQVQADELANRRREVAGRRAAVRRERRANRLNAVHAAADAQARALNDADLSREQVLGELERGLNSLYGVDFRLADRLDEAQLSELEQMVRDTFANPDAFAREDQAEATVRRAREMLFQGTPAGAATNARAMFDEAGQEVQVAAGATTQGSSTFAAGPLDMQARIVQEAKAGDRLGPPPNPGVVTDPATIARVEELARRQAATQEAPGVQDERDDGNAAAGPAPVEDGVRERGAGRDGGTGPAPAPVQDRADQAVAEPEQRAAEPAPEQQRERPARAEVEPEQRSAPTRTFTLPTKQVTTRPEEFQTRRNVGKEGYDERKVDGIIKAMKDGTFTGAPITVWKAENGEWVVLDGHHTLEAQRRMGVEQVEVQEFKGTREQAEYVADTANDAGDVNDPASRASTARKQREKSGTKGEWDAWGKSLYGKEWPTVKALSFLNPNGRLMDAVAKLANNADAQGDVLKMARWIGRARERYDTLTDAHEAEMFKFLEKNIGQNGLTSEAAFTDLVEQRGMMGDFSGMESLNLNKIKPSSPESRSYEALLKEAKAEKSRLTSERDAEAKKYEDRAETSTDQGEKSNLLAAAKRVRDRYNEMIRAQDMEIARIKTEWRAVQDRGNTQGTMFFGGEQDNVTGENIEEQFVSGGRTWDQRNGAGGVPSQRNVNYEGYTVWMKPGEFLSLNPPRYQPMHPETAEKIRSGEPIATPFLVVNVNEETGSVRVTQHEGRGRAQVLHEIDPNTPIPVTVLPQHGMRARHLSAEIVTQPIIPDKRASARGAVRPSRVMWQGKFVGEGTSFFGRRSAAGRFAESMGVDPADVREVAEPKSGGFDVVRRLANLFGLDVTFVEYTPNGIETALPSPGGYEKGSRRIFIDVNSQDALPYIVLHEIGHDLTMTDPELMRKLLTMVRVESTPMLPDSALSSSFEFQEIAADLFAQAALDPNFLKRASKIEPGLVSLIRQKLADMMAAIRALLQKYNLDMRPYFKSMDRINALLQEAGLERIRQVKAGKLANDPGAQGVLFFRLDQTKKELDRVEKSNESPEMKEMLERNVKADARERAKGRFTKERARRAFYKRIVDRNHALYTHVRDALKAAGHDIRDLAYEARPDKVMQMFRGWTGKAMLMLRYGVKDKDGNHLSDGLEQIIHNNGIAKAIDDGTFSQFLTSMRVMALYKLRGEAFFTDPVKHPDEYAAQKAELAKHEAIVESYKGRKNWEKAAKEITQYANSVMNRALEAGIITEEAYQAMLEADIYAPMFVLEMADQQMQAGRPKAGAGPVTYTQGQLLAEVARQDPIDGLIKTTYRINHLAEQNIAKMALTDVIADVCKMVGVKVGEGIEGLGRRVKPEQMPRWKSAEDMLRAMGFSFRGHPDWKETRKRHYAEAKAEILGESGMEWADMSKEDKAEIVRLANQEANARATEEISEIVVASLEQQGMNLGQGDSARAVLENFHELWVAAQLQKDGVITVMRDGKREYWQVDPELFDVFVSGDKNGPAWQVLRKVWGSQTKLLRGGVLLTPEFMAKNPMRDIIMAAIQTQNLVDVKELPYAPVVMMTRLFKGILHVVRKDEVWQDWVRWGGAMAEMVSVDREGARDNTKKMTRAKQVRGRSIRIPTNPLEFLHDLSAVTEQASRVAVFERTRGKQMKAGKSMSEASAIAAIESREGSLDFGRSGTWGEVLNTMIPFFNAGVQGTDKLMRTLLVDGDAKQKAAAWTKLFWLVTAPSIALWLKQGDEEWYKERPLWEKNMFWIFSPDGGKTRMYWPKPFEAGLLFGSLPERLLDYAAHRDSKGVGKVLDDIVTTAVPTSVYDFGGPLFKSLMEAKSNYDNFRDEKIVRGRAEQAEARDQYTRSTTSLAKVAGDKWPFRSGGASPAKIEHVIRGGTGGLGVNALRGLSWAYDQTLGKEQAERRPAAQEVFGVPTDTPFVGRLARTFVQQEPTAYTRHVDDYYEMFDHAMSVVNSYNINEKAMNRDRLASIMRREGVWIAAASAVRKQNEAINKLNSQIRMLENAPADRFSQKEKRERINEILIQRSQVCEEAYRRMMSVVNDETYQKKAAAMADKIERKK